MQEIVFVEPVKREELASIVGGLTAPGGNAGLAAFAAGLVGGGASGNIIVGFANGIAATGAVDVQNQNQMK